MLVEIKKFNCNFYMSIGTTEVYHTCASSSSPSTDHIAKLPSRTTLPPHWIAFTKDGCTYIGMCIYGSLLFYWLLIKHIGTE